MFNVFKIYRNHKRFIEIQRLAIELVQGNNDRTCTAKRLKRDGLDVELQDRRVLSNIISSMAVAYLFNPLEYKYTSSGALDEPSSFRADFHLKLIDKIKNL